MPAIQKFEIRNRQSHNSIQDSKMKGLMAITLILFGTIWAYFASINSAIVRTRAMSDVMQMEAEFQIWAIDKVSESELREIFPENYSLRFDGKSKNWNFRTMIEEIVASSTPPMWPGLVAVFIGIFGVFSAFRDKGNKNAAII